MQRTAQLTLGIVEFAGGVLIIVKTGGLGAAVGGTYFVANGLDEAIAGIRKITGESNVRTFRQGVVDRWTGDQGTTDTVLLVVDLGTLSLEKLGPRLLKRIADRRAARAVGNITGAADDAANAKNLNAHEEFRNV